jgi:hypothetical protein
MRYVDVLADQIATRHSRLEIVLFEILFALFDALVLATVVRLFARGPAAYGVAIGLSALAIVFFLPVLVATHRALTHEGPAT